MITVKQESKLLEKIKSMTELEFVTFFEELGDHIEFEGWQHVIKKYYNADDFEHQIEDLNETIETLEGDNRRLNDAIFELELQNSNLEESLRKIAEKS